MACGIISNEGKVLICRRAAHKHLAGFWEFPGGKVEPGEDPGSSLKRELSEELGMEIGNAEYFMEHVHDYGDFKIKLIAYRCVFLKASFEMTDHDIYSWVDIRMLKGIRLAAADVPIALALAIEK